MRRARIVGIVLAAAAVVVAGFATAGAEGTPQYVGAGKCKMCHNSARKGAQYKVWADTKHAHAFMDLASPKAMEIATAKGVKDPQKAPECLQCHVTGYGEPADHFAASFSDSAGVGCESCHGAGSQYLTRTVMMDIRSGKSKPEEFGLHMPTAATCAKCHNEKSPSGKSVDWAADSAKIAHPIPAGAETEDAK
jgi:formate-dependent nitrite reductase cytochrome c552 subunit